MRNKISAAQYLTSRMRGTTKKASDYVGQHSSQVKSAAGNAARRSGNAITKGMDKAADRTMDGAFAAGKAIHSKAPLTTKVDKDISNLWLGRREGLGLIGLSAAAAVGVNAYSHASSPYRDQRLGQVDYNGSAPIMDGDGVGKEQRPATGNAPTMGASGDMVFGMHEARRGMV